MRRSIALAATLLAATACADMGMDGARPAATAAAAAPAPPAAGGMRSGQRMMVSQMPPGTTLRNVMISQGGGGVDLVYAMPPGSPQSQQVVRLENVNGMLEVQYDTAMGAAMPLGSGGAPRLVQQGGGMYNVVYDAEAAGQPAGGTRRPR